MTFSHVLFSNCKNFALGKNSVVMCFRKQICFIETFCKTVLHVYMCNYILKQIQLAEIKRILSLKT